MKFTELKILTTHNLADTISAVLFSAGAEGVDIKDKSDVLETLNSSTNWDYVDDSVLSLDDNKAIVTTVINENPADFIAKFNGILACLLPDLKVDIKQKELENLDWTTEWKKHYKPIKTKSITVVPSWIDYNKSKDEKIIKLEPGMAFGTGEHATTRMCLDMSDNLEGKKVLDVGCGSGILGISAKILGAKSVYMCDLDPQCIEASIKNADYNGVDVTIEQADLLSKSDMVGDVVYANLTANILLRLSKGITNHISKGGYLIMSGIIDSREQEVIKEYLSLGFEIADKRGEDDWRAYKLLWK